MYGLLSDPGIDILKGQSLIQVCIGQNDIFLNFSGDISIGVFSCIGLGKNRDNIMRVSDFAKACQDLLALLSIDVSDVRWTKEGTISITFETGHLIELYDDSKQFESYTIRTSERLIVV